VLVLVGGPPGAGKTTLAHQLGEALALPVLSRDRIKSGMAQTRGIHDSARGRELARPSFALFYDTIARFLGAGCPIVAEQAFLRGVSEQDLVPLAAGSRPVYIHCHASRAECSRRIAARASDPTRHPSHPDAQLLAQIDAGSFDWDSFGPLAIGVTVIPVDTNSTVDIPVLASRIRSHVT
jgi:predicted kinase